METKTHADVTKRHDFVLLFEVTDGNPNGDPDAGNLPRVDPETMNGLVTDVAIKRKVRDWIDASRGDGARFKIYVQSGGELLNAKHQRAYDDLHLKSTGTKQKKEDVEATRAWMCQNFYDIRVFGAVMTTGVNCGQVRGPLQITFARSLDPIVPLDLSITRVVRTDPKEKNAENSEGTMGRKAFVPYGLYRAYGFFNPYYAARTSVTEEDLDLFWQALQQVWDLDRSSARGMMACRGLYVFSHDSALGNAPAQQLFDRIEVTCRPEVVAPRRFADYEVHLRNGDLPAGVSLITLVG
jgi:CRISPR-associated protein Csd2